MIALTNDAPLFRLYKSLLEEFKYGWADNIQNSQHKNINSDPLLKLILENNGCAFCDNSSFIRWAIDDEGDGATYFVYFIYAAKANGANDFFDYIEFYGSKNLIIFTDYFKDMIKDRADPEKDPLEFAMGKSVYFDAIKKIVELFLCTSTPMAEINSPLLAATSAANNYRFAGTIIAALVINSICGLTEEDVSEMEYGQLMNMITSIKPQFLLNGIRYQNTTNDTSN